MTIVVTGAAGFIGSHVAAALLERGETVLGLDNVNDYYSVALKEARLARLQANPRFRFIKVDLSKHEAVEALAPDFAEVTGVVHLAAQAGVRYSLENPYAYIDANVTGQVAMLEAARRMPKLKHFVYASTSSVYGANKTMPFSVEDRVDSPMSIYAATKKAAEMMTYSYCHLYKLPATGLRFFTVYGPWGRPDMAAFLFADAIIAGRPIRVFNNGRMKRDFTFIEESLGRKAVMQMEPLQKGDVPETTADIEASRRDLGYEPKTPIDIGLPRFVAWYKEYHGIA